MLTNKNLKPKHAIGALTAGVIALAAGTAAQQGFLPHWEGVKHRISHNSFDPKGIYDVCNGHVVNLKKPDIRLADYYTDAMCSDILAMDLPRYNAQIAGCLPKDFMVGDHQHTAILAFDYNVGEGNFCNGSVGKLFRAGKRDEACRAMGKYTRAAGRVLPGLERRRYDQFWGDIEWCLRED